MPLQKTCCLLIASFCIALFPYNNRLASGDEGMWLFSNLPIKLLATKYGFDVTDEWSQKLRMASVRFNSGGSAAFVSSTGLVLTNHHVGSDAIQKLSTAEKDYLANGFLAKFRDEELPAVDLELNQLVLIEDVTDRVNNAVAGKDGATEAAKARRAEIARIEKEANIETKNRCNVITLYGGGRYHLYQFKRYTDVRLVWAPESDAAFFGGDADNFEYPRYCLDACLFRVYENGKPAKIDHFLKWNTDGPDPDDKLVFVSGNPGRTSRIYTTEALRYERDHSMPAALDYIRRREILYQQYALNSPESAFQVNDAMLGIQNARKAYVGMLAGLQNPQYMMRKAQEEQKLIARIKQDPSLSNYADAWETVAKAQAQRAELRKELFSLNTGSYSLARSFVRLAVENSKPNDERFPEFRDSSRDSLKQKLLSKAKLYLDLERAKLADSISRTLEIRGADSPLCRELLNHKCPIGRADELIAGTKIDSFEFRADLYKKVVEEGKPEAVLESDDAMIKLAIAMDAEQRRLRAADEKLDEIERQAYGQIAEVMFALKGQNVYPDATFSLRLTFGEIKGYHEKGKAIPEHTTLAGAFDHEKRHSGKDPWKLPESWHNAKDKLNGDTPFNFVSTADIVGGNSGSPVVNRELELIGLVFDGNKQSLTSDFFYSEQKARAISVNSAAISEALRKIYDAGHIADELGK